MDTFATCAAQGLLLIKFRPLSAVSISTFLVFLLGAALGKHVARFVHLSYQQCRLSTFSCMVEPEAQ